MTICKKLEKLVLVMLSVLLFFTVLSVQRVEAVDITEDDLIGKWEARLKVNKLELYGTMKDQRDNVYQEEKVPQTVTFLMHEGKLAVSLGSTPVPVTLSGGKLSGTYSEGTGFFPINESTLKGTVRKTEKGIEFTIKTSGEAWSKDRKNGWICSYTYTSAGATPAPATPTAPESEATSDAQEPIVEEEEVIAVESIIIEPRLFFLKKGTQRQLNVKVKPPNAKADDVIIKSYDSNVIDINAKAEVIGRNAGYSEIVATTRDGKIHTKSKVFVGSETEVVGLMLDNLWLKTKDFLAGESFQVKTPTATCGVRG